MLPPYVINAILVLIAILVVVLLARIALKWFAGRGTDETETRAVASPPPAAPAARPDEHVPVVDFEEIPEEQRTPVVRTTAPAYRPVADWQDRDLFTSSARRDRENGLPAIGADDVPTTPGDDYVFGSALTPAFASLLPESDDRRKAVKRDLVNAGYYEPHAWHNLAAIRYVGIVLMLVLFGGLLVILPEQFELLALGGLFLGPLLAWSLPRLMVRGKANDRISEIERGMPDMLDMLNMCVSQGLTVPHALARISREMYTAYPALAQELAIVVEQSRVGTLEQALYNFQDRVDVPEVNSFVALLTQTERMGTSVSEALTDYSDGMRESLRQRADTKANQATFKLLFPTVLCLMPAVYLFLLGPALIELTNFVEGGGLDAVTEGGAALQQIQNN